MILCPRCHAENKGDARFCERCGENLAALSQKGKDPFIGRILSDKYLILDHLGDGGMGKVYKAEQLSLSKNIAIKILHKELLQNDTQVKRFQREALLASRLEHPNSINIIDFGKTEEGAHFLAMEALSGVELSDVIKKEFPLSTERTVHIMMQVCSVLSEAHANTIVHRDLKPENIMLIDRMDDPNFVKVLDFGIAKLHERDPNEPAITMQGMVCGTPEYMSPEQAMGKELDPRTDLYSLGCVLYEMLTQRVPFRNPNPQALLAMHIKEKPVPPSQLMPDLNIDPALEKVALKAMKKKVENRYQSSMEMRQALEAILVDSGAYRPTSASQPIPTPPQTPPPPPQNGNLNNIPTQFKTSDTSSSSPMVPDPYQAQQRGEPVSTAEVARMAGMGGGNRGKMIVGAVAALVLVVGGIWVAFGGDDAPQASSTPKKEIQADSVATKLPALLPPSPEHEPDEPAEKNVKKADVPRKVAPKSTPKPTRTASTKTEPQKAPPVVAAVKDEPEPEPAQKTEKKKSKKLDAAERMEKALEYYEKGKQEFSKGNVDAAIRNYKKSLKYNPRSSRTHKLLGQAYQSQGKNALAKKHFGQYLRYNPNAPDASIIQGMIDSL